MKRNMNSEDQSVYKEEMNDNERRPQILQQEYMAVYVNKQYLMVILRCNITRPEEIPKPELPWDILSLDMLIYSI